MLPHTSSKDIVDVLDPRSQAIWALHHYLNLRPLITPHSSRQEHERLGYCREKCMLQIQTCELDAFMGLLRGYCEREAAQRSLEVTMAMLGRLRETGVIRALWKREVFWGLLQDEMYGYKLGMLLSYGFMDYDEIGEVAEGV